MKNELVSKKLLPHYSLLEWIKLYWLLEGKGNLKKNSEKHILPDGCTTILFILQGKIKLGTYENKELKEGIYIIPPVLKSHKDLVSDNIYFIDIQLNPGVFYQLFNFPVNEFDARIYEFKDISINFDENILDRLIELKDSKLLLLNELNNFFSELFYKNDFFGDNILIGLSHLYKNGDLENFYANQNKSERQMQRKVKSITGLTPKMISRIGRFYKVLEESNGNYKELKDSTFFADQSHLIKEFKYFTGITPQSFLNKELDFLQYDAIINNIKV